MTQRRWSGPSGVKTSKMSIYIGKFRATRFAAGFGRWCNCSAFFPIFCEPSILRLSSTGTGWSETVIKKMGKFRIFVRFYGRTKAIATSFTFCPYSQYLCREVANSSSQYTFSTKIVHIQWSISQQIVDLRTFIVCTKSQCFFCILVHSSCVSADFNDKKTKSHWNHSYLVNHPVAGRNTYGARNSKTKTLKSRT